MKKMALQLLIAVFGAGLLNAQSPQGPAARLAIRSGLVEVQRGNAWLPIAPGEPLNAGERIRTASGSTAAIEVGPGKVVTLSEQSQVQVGQSNTSPVMQLESGSMRVFTTSDIQVAAKDTMLQSDGRPLDMQLGYQADKLNLRVFNGAVRNGQMTIQGGNEDPAVRTYTANGRSSRHNHDDAAVNPTFYVYPYFWYPGPNAGAIVPPVVNNPTHPAYRPTQIVPPMTDPIRVPVTRR